MHTDDNEILADEGGIIDSCVRRREQKIREKEEAAQREKLDETVQAAITQNRKKALEALREANVRRIEDDACEIHSCLKRDARRTCFRNERLARIICHATSPDSRSGSPPTRVPSALKCCTRAARDDACAVCWLCGTHVSAVLAGHACIVACNTSDELVARAGAKLGQGRAPSIAD